MGVGGGGKNSDAGSGHSCDQKITGALAIGVPSAFSTRPVRYAPGGMPSGETRGVILIVVGEGESGRRRVSSKLEMVRSRSMYGPMVELRLRKTKRLP